MRYGDIGTPERAIKNGGVIKAPKGNQDCVIGFSDWPSLFFDRGVIDEDQHASFLQFVRDYNVGIMYKWTVVKSLLKASGLSPEEADVEREEARVNCNAVIRFNPELKSLLNYAHTTLEEVENGMVGLYLPLGGRLLKLVEILTKYYKDNHRIKITCMNDNY